MTKTFPVIDLVATGENIIRLRKARGLTVRDLQNWFGFEEPQAIYKWQKGKCLPTVDNLYALGVLLDVPIEDILVQYEPNIKNSGQQGNSCCPLDFLPGSFEYDRTWSHVPIWRIRSGEGGTEGPILRGDPLLPKGLLICIQNGEVSWSCGLEEKRDGGGFA